MGIVLFSIFVGGLIGTVPAASSWPYENETKEQRDARMAWWRQSRFGMFIHWGVYAVPAGTYDGKQIGGIGEWIMHNGKIPVAEYKEYAKQFNPVKYDPDQWVQLAKEAGIEGRVYVKFVINEKGNVVNPKVVRGIGGGCDQAAIEAVKKAKFVPGLQRGKPVKVWYTMPIYFKLQK